MYFIQYACSPCQCSTFLPSFGVCPSLETFGFPFFAIFASLLAWPLYVRLFIPAHLESRKCCECLRCEHWGDSTGIDTVTYR